MNRIKKILSIILDEFIAFIFNPHITIPLGIAVILILLLLEEV